VGNGQAFIEIWSNEKRRNWRFWIYGIYPEPVISRFDFADRGNL
jgi:hypothetical protein